jgi:hypothetical protein
MKIQWSNYSCSLNKGFEILLLKLSSDCKASSHFRDAEKSSKRHGFVQLAIIVRDAFRGRGDA